MWLPFLKPLDSLPSPLHQRPSSLIRIPRHYIFLFAILVLRLRFPPPSGSSPQASWISCCLSVLQAILLAFVLSLPETPFLLTLSPPGYLLFNLQVLVSMAPLLEGTLALYDSIKNPSCGLPQSLLLNPLLHLLHCIAKAIQWAISSLGTISFTCLLHHLAQRGLT